MLVTIGVAETIGLLDLRSQADTSYSDIRSEVSGWLSKRMLSRGRPFLEGLNACRMQTTISVRN
ncbi:hypothetical protein AHF37_12745 [Paragonimus kellicotti]|nr:hypothetical protein AHF37_12745 [Paragonimus kellicotti]